MKRIAVVSFFLLLYYSLNAQVNKSGVPLVNSFSSEVTKGSEQNWWITRDRFGALYLANDDRGVIRFDGTNWTSIPARNNARVRALDCDNNGLVFVGGAYEFGYIEPDKSGVYSYVSLSARYEKVEANGSSADSLPAEKSEVNIGEIVSLVVADSMVYYLSDESLFVYNSESDSLEYYNLRNLGFRQFIRIYKINNRIFLAENIQGLFEFRDGRILDLPGGRKYAGSIILSILPIEGTRVLISDYRKGLSAFDYESGEIDDKWADQALKGKVSQVYCGAKLATGEYIIGTINGNGIYVLDKNGKLTGIWNTSTGVLADNLIYALYADQVNNELWVAISGAICRLSTNYPFGSFSESQGLDAPVNAVEKLGDDIFVATDNGIYKSYLDNYNSIHFKALEAISDQSFPILNAKVDRNEFILAGTILGLYQILPSGNVVDLITRIVVEKDKSKPTFSSRAILQSVIDPHIFFLGTTGDGVHMIKYLNGVFFHQWTTKAVQGTISYMSMAGNGDLFVLTDYPNALYRIPNNDTTAFKIDPKRFHEGAIISNIDTIDKNVIVSTNKGLFRYDNQNDDWLSVNDLTGGYSAGREINNFYHSPDGDLWVEFSEARYSLVMFTKADTQFVYYKNPFNVFPNVKMPKPKYIDGKTWIPKSKNIFVINKDQLGRKTSKPVSLLIRIQVGEDSVLMNGTFFKKLDNGKRVPVTSNKGLEIPEIRYTLNSISLYWTTPSFISEDQALYSYRLEGFSDEWSRWEPIHYKDFTNLPFGRYTFRVKALSAANVETEEATFEFIILKPWYLTAWMIILYMIVIVLVVFGIIKAYTRRLRNENIRLEGIVAERTAVVVKQKEELESSIHYASRIQMALLPSEAILSENLKNYFILFRPRDIVSGDFYWMTKKDNRLYIVAADCTGHGVPGAFMSLLGMSFLDEIIDKESAPRADFILSELRLHVTESLKQSGGENEAKDGMDMALLVIDFNVSRIEFSGAYNPCFRVRKLTDEEQVTYKNNSDELPDGSMSNGKYLLETIVASKMPIGISSRMDEKFVFFDWKLEKGVSYYLFSDGYIDQFGGPSGRKFMKKNFKRVILDIQDYPMNRQKELLEQNLREWMGQTPQIDDILVMGIRTE